MMIDVSQKQQGAKDSTNFQIGNLTIKNGLDYLQVQSICHDLIKDNFTKLKNEALEIVDQRLEIFCNKFISKLEDNHVNNLEELKNPDMQYILYESQKGFIRNGNPNMCELLTSLLVERLKESDTSLLQLNLNEACLVIPKLLPKHLNMLTISFFISSSKESNIDNTEELISYLKLKVIPFAVACNPIYSDVQYLEYTGCGSFKENYGLGVQLVNSYKGILKLDEYFPNGNMKKLIFTDDDAQIIKDDGEKVDIREYLTSKEPELEYVFKIYNDNHLRLISLTSVGNIVGAYNYMINTGDNIDISNFFI